MFLPYGTHNYNNMSFGGNRKRKYGRVQNSPAVSIASTVQTSQSLRTSISELSVMSNTDNSPSSSDLVQVRRQRSLIKSKYWKWYKPKDEQRLIHLVFTNSNSLHDVAFRCAQLFEDNEDYGVICLIQFFVDVTGYPEYSVETNNVREIVDYLEENISDVIHKHDYILKFNFKWYKQAQIAIFEFIKDLLEQNHLIYKFNIITYFISLFKMMSSSKMVSVKHAGVIFALRFAVSCANSLKIVQSDLKNAQKSFLISTEELDKIQKQIHNITEKQDMLNEYLKNLYAIICSNYLYKHKSLVTMHMMCADNIYSLLQALPELFFCKFKCIPILVELLSDQSNKVRASAMKTLKKLFSNDEYKEYMGKFMGKILNILHQVLYDVNINMVASAIDVITYVLKIYPYGITNETRRVIFCMVYHKTYAVGKVAGNFLVTFLRIHWGNDGDAAIIEKFIKFQHTSEKLHLMPTIVESVIENMPELQSYARIINILADRNLELKYAITLLDVLRHTVSQIITGKSEQTRTDSRQGAINIAELNNIRCNLIPNLIILLERYREREYQEILISILLVCFSTKVLIASHREDVKKIFKILHQDFFNCNDRVTLDMISQIYKQMNDDLNPLKLLATAEVECCILKVIDTFNCSDNSTDLIESMYIRLAILYQYFNLSERGFIWSIELLQNFGMEINNILLCHIESGCYMLVWELQMLLESDGNLSKICNDIENINIFNIKCIEYLHFCFSYWDQSQDVQAKVFWCVCDLLQKFHCELKNLVVSNPELKDLYFNLESEQQECMNNFLKAHVLNTSVPYHFACIYLEKFLNTAILNQNAIPLEMMVPVFGCYSRLYEKYQKFFDAILDVLRKAPNSVLENFILKVLIAEYNKLENKQIFTSIENINLAKLAEKYSLYLLPFHRLFDVLYLSLQNCVKHPDNVSFLRYLYFFIDPLKQADRMRILKIAGAALEDYKDNEHVTFFLKRVNAKYISNRNVQALNESRTTSGNISSENESENSDKKS